MIMALLWFVIILSLAILFLGYYVKVPLIPMIGWAFMFLIAVNFMIDGLQFQTGENITEEIPCEWYINESCEQGYGYYNVTTTTAYNYETYTNHLFSFWLAILSATGFISVLFTKNYWGSGINNKD